MRRSILAIILASSLTTGAFAADPVKTHATDVEPGRVAWFDISTKNMAISKEFYGKLFDWQFQGIKGTDMAAEIVSSGTAIGTLRRAEGPVSAYNGVAYIQVVDIQASTKKAKDLGGTIPPGFPFNLSDGRGAVGLVVDPAGHPIGLYSRTPFPEPPAAKP